MSAVMPLALADFRERVRRFSFLVVVALAVFLGYQVISGTFELRLGSYRGLLNAAWIGTLMALTLSFFLSLIGFYILRGNVAQDQHTGVGQILAATPMTRLAYVMGKFISNIAVLMVVTVVLAAAALAMLAIHGEDRALDFYHLLMPFLVFTLPVALLVAAVTVFFECTPRLRHNAGNVLYFILWMVMVPVIGGDLLAFSRVEQAMGAALQAQGASYQGGIVLGATDVLEMQTFLWTGFDWAAMAVTRLVYIAAALLLAAAAAVPFERFDPSRAAYRQPAPRQAGFARRISQLSLQAYTRLTARRSGMTAQEPASATSADLTPVTASAHPLQLYIALVTAELKLLLKGRSVLWYLVAAGLLLACLLAPVESVQRWWLPMTWLWPLLLWSEMGVSAVHFRVDQLLHSAPAPLRRQLLSAWTAGLLLALILGGAAFFRFLAAPQYLPGFAAGALFIPSLALLLGVLGGSQRPTQILLLIWWYLGPLNGLVAFDITGATTLALERGIPWFYMAASPLLMGITWLVQRSQLR